MKNFRHVFPALLVTLFAGCAAAPPTPTTAGLTESGTFAVREDQIMRLATGASGKGTLIYLGWEHRFTFTDAKVTIEDGGSAEIEGTVYNLDKLEDFEGTYKPIKAEFEEGEGLVGGWARNDKGVTIHIRYDDRDLSVNLQAKGATVTLVR